MYDNPPDPNALYAYYFCVSFNSSVGTQIESKSKIAKFLKSLLSSENGRLNPSSFSNKVSRSS